MDPVREPSPDISVPATLPVTTGTVASGHNAIFYFRRVATGTAASAYVGCIYAGAGSTYDFVSCDDGSTAAQPARVDYLGVHIVSGDGPVTRVRVELGETPSTCTTGTTGLANVPSVITSSPDLDAVVGEPWSYSPTATDANPGDTPFYEFGWPRPGLGGVRVSVSDQPELGYTLTRPDGAFDLVVNGGRFVTLDFVRGGYTQAQRRWEVSAHDFETAPDVALAALDTAVTSIDLTSITEHTVASATEVADDLSLRSASMIFAPGTSAVMTLEDGTTQYLPRSRSARPSTRSGRTVRRRCPASCRSPAATRTPSSCPWTSDLVGCR